MLAVPDQTIHRTKVADWLELRAVSSPDGRIGFETLVSATALTENEQKEDIADEDIEEDQLVLYAQEEIARRSKNIGDDYPFRIDDQGRVLQFITPVSEVGSVYLFCLFLSHAFDRTIVPKSLAPKVTNKTRDLFQACATIAAEGMLGALPCLSGFPALMERVSLGSPIECTCFSETGGPETDHAPPLRGKSKTMELTLLRGDLQLMICPACSI